ncbi:hypothetical protein GGE12_002615 [Rhizobium mongolense]|uniref:Uncharacterized protein n=1 Tax=Rhizobium mongolense TaxID=57676 RepID=A0A7W6WEN8_9HYPH|nr:hypothetical protein [Rhizobium mongolense]
MGSMPIVAMEPFWQLVGSHVRGWVCDGIGPFPKRGLNEAFGLAIGFWRIGSCSDVLEAKFAAGAGKFA